MKLPRIAVLCVLVVAGCQTGSSETTELRQSGNLDLDSKYDLHRSRGLLHYDRKEYDKAIKDYTQMISLKPTDVTGYRMRAMCYERSKDYRNAAKDGLKAVELGTPNKQDYQFLAMILATCPVREVRDPKKAVEYATRACELSKWKDGESLETLGVTYAVNWQFEEAIRWQRAALELPTYAKVHGQRGRARLKSYEQSRSVSAP